MDLKEKNIDKRHSNELGLGIPEDYFLKSRNEILAKVSAKKESKVIAFYQRKMVWFAAAGIALIVALTVYRQNSIPSFYNIPTIVSDTLNSTKNLDLATEYFYENDILLATLFVNDAQIDTYVNNTFMEDVIEDEYLDDCIVENLMTDDLF